ncbi:hypothetical protein SAMN04489798_3708 [Pseudomonas arsenicoxydans]|uniref:Uncharacterized protein n=1 Tax=Pseudomonas arsenicoxydans TaxID=702115 RepID=A0A1H0LZ56_9PSED|nr:hypothetical protein [Pseudomonas arsenicoxydans]SDO73256.1 hypothetical protein SAMN04489798_3708 [Pseudomonas arsenicoxydans]
MTLADLQRLSVSQSELVLPYPLAITALQLLEATGAILMGWEGCLRYPDGRLGHSDMHQGTTNTSALSSSEAYSWAKVSMRLSQKEYELQNETTDIKLLFCIILNA